MTDHQQVTVTLDREEIEAHLGGPITPKTPCPCGAIWSAHFCPLDSSAKSKLRAALDQTPSGEESRVECFIDEIREEVELLAIEATGVHDPNDDYANEVGQYVARKAANRLTGALERLDGKQEAQPSGEEGEGEADVITVYRRMKAAAEGARAERDIMRAAVEMIADGPDDPFSIAQDALDADRKRREANLAALAAHPHDQEAPQVSSGELQASYGEIDAEMAAEVSPGDGEWEPWRADDSVIEGICAAFHDEYEGHAAEVGWETQESTRVAFRDLPEENRAAMVGTVRALLERHVIYADRPSTLTDEERERLRVVFFDALDLEIRRRRATHLKPEHPPTIHLTDVRAALYALEDTLAGKEHR